MKSLLNKILLLALVSGAFTAPIMARESNDLRGQTKPALKQRAHEWFLITKTICNATWRDVQTKMRKMPTESDKEWERSVLAFVGATCARVLLSDISNHPLIGDLLEN